MPKFKVGDKVRVIDFKENPPHWAKSGGMDKWKGKIVTLEKIARTNVTSDMEFSLGEDRGEVLGQKWVWKSSDFEPVEPRREFIVIHRSGNVMTAEHRVNREVIKSAKATCAPSDTFDFEVGAKLAFDRLMGREKQNGTSPADIFFALTGRPAPEPPKFYTGKVVMVDCEFPDRKHLINHMFEFKDGRQVGNKVHGMSFNYAPYTSFEQIVSTHNASTWIEVKE